jgi:hypothetical protein
MRTCCWNWRTNDRGARRAVERGYPWYRLADVDRLHPSKLERQCPDPGLPPIFELGGYWIGREKGKRAFYAYWHDAGTGHSRRRSLGCTNLEDAKKKLAELFIKGDTKTPDAFVSAAVLLSYFEARTDKLPSKPQSAAPAARC